MVDKPACDFVIVKGTKKGQKCGNSCITIEGEEPRCFKHKSKYLESHCRKQKEKSAYQTKDMRISELEQSRQELLKKCQQQENQIGILTEELTCTKTEIIALKNFHQEMEEKFNRQENQIQNLLIEFNTIKAKISEFREVNQNLHTAFQEETKNFKAELDSIHKNVYEKTKALEEGCRQAFLEISRKLSLLEVQNKELCDYSVKKTTKRPKIIDQIEKNTKSIAEIQQYLKEQRNSWW